MKPFHVIKTEWQEGDQRKIEDWRVDRQEGLTYDSYRRLHGIDQKKWTIAGQVMKSDGRKYYILECVG